MNIIREILVIFLLTYIAHSDDKTYSRDWLQKEYPGFGKDFVIFPGQNNEEIFGYFTTKNLGRMDIDLTNFTNFDISSDITFTLYTRKIANGRTITHVKDASKYFDKTKQTKFVTHGWMSSGTSDTCIDIKNGFLNKSDVNVFIMDWSSIAGNIFYPIPMEATSRVGEEYSKFINQLIQKMDLNPKDVHLVGHSLGAHVAGFAGRKISGKPARITGLDPALPGFNLGLINGGHLNYNDADFVDVIHTCAGFLGMRDPIGHVDFYPNGGGPPQPGCGILQFIEACSHGRSWKLFANSITLNKPYLASKCQSYNDISRNDCNGDYIPMGESTPPTARGVYYIKTKDEDPYVRNLNFIDTNDLEVQ